MKILILKKKKKEIEFPDQEYELKIWHLENALQRININ